MNCIFVCVFNQEQYVDMFLMLLESICLYGGLDIHTDMLIYTSTSFMIRIKQNTFFNNSKMKFEINDAYNDINKSCKSRLDLFNLSSIKKYNKILYLDTDILIKKEINKVFDLCVEDVLYALGEGEITRYEWGDTLFGDEAKNYADKTAFSSGILLFNNCEKIQFLFRKINEDLISRYHSFYDQPYIVYNAFKYNLYNNQLLKNVAVINDQNIHSDMVIHHFPSGPGIYQPKLIIMTDFLSRMRTHCSNKKKFTLCLNMIVKDESHVIITTLKNICEKIDFDYWVICDTGSSDNTKELIQEFFDDKKIKGELISNQWVNFGHNRSLALKYAFNKTDYVLVFDADDTLVGNFCFPENMFEYDSYALWIGNKSVRYQRKMIFNNRKEYKFIGVLHEFPECSVSDTVFSIHGDYYIISGKTGNRSLCVDKYLNDALLLENAYNEALLQNDDIHMRYAFYCANSYFDANKIKQAILWYKKTLTLNNWDQEKYISCLRIYESYEKLNAPEKGFYYLIDSYKYDTERVECFYRLINYYTKKSQYDVAFSFYSLIQLNYEKNYMNEKFSKLFLYYGDYSIYLPYYMIIVCERLGKYDIGLKMFDIIFSLKNVDVDTFWIKNLVYNLQFFLERNTSTLFIEKWREYLSIINEKNHIIDTDLVNKYEILTVSKFVDVLNPLPDSNRSNGQIVIAILAKDKASVLPFYLECIYNQTYSKKLIHLYIRTNDNTDDTDRILKLFVQKHGKEYASIYFNDKSVSEKLKTYKPHEWNSFRFKELGKIRQESIDYAIDLGAHYFVVDCDNFIIPTTIDELYNKKHHGVISPMLVFDGYDADKNNYANYHYLVTANGYYEDHPAYYAVLHHNIVGLIRVCCVHCTYFIDNKFLNKANYSGEQADERYEYIIFSESLRKNNIPQFIDNTCEYGFLTFSEGNEEVIKNIYLHNKTIYNFNT